MPIPALANTHNHVHTNFYTHPGGVPEEMRRHGSCLEEQNREITPMPIPTNTHTDTNTHSYTHLRGIIGGGIVAGWEGGSALLWKTRRNRWSGGTWEVRDRSVLK